MKISGNTYLCSAGPREPGRVARRLVVLAAAILLTGAAQDALAQCGLDDRWAGQDKRWHFGAGVGVAAAVTAYTDNPWAGFYAGAAVGVAKEAYDTMGKGRCSIPDLLITVAGASLGAYTTHIVISHSKGQTMISYTMNF